MRDVAAFYDVHPINEAEVLSKLQAAGKDIDALQPEDLLAFDQDHYGGTEATDVLAQRLALSPGETVLDVCAGLGGTSRYLAWKHGCTVTGVDLTQSRVDGANALTRRVGLSDCVTVVQGDATELPPTGLRAGEFDAAVSQESFCHIPHKSAVLEACRRMLRKGGRLGFTDILAGPELGEADRAQLSEGILFFNLITAEQYEEALRRAGFREVAWEDLAPMWSRILRGRLEMYRSLEDETVKRFGREQHERYIAIYTHFVDCIESGRLGGGRFIATC